MRRQSLADEISDLWAADYTTKVAVEQMATGDVDVPGYDSTNPVTTGLPIAVVQMSARERQTRQAMYSVPPTHDGYCEDGTYLLVGYQLRETHRMDGLGRWVEVLDEADQSLWQIVAIERLPRLKLAGVSPTSQVRLILSETTPMR